MKRRILALIAAVSLILSTLSGCTAQEEKTKKAGSSETVLNIGFPELGSMDVSMLRNPHALKIMVGLYEPLVRLTRDGEVTLDNGLAKEVTADDDKTEFTIELHDNAKWENGDPLTAHDYVYSLRRTLDPKTAAPYAMQLFDFKNAMQVYTGQMQPEELGAKAVDDYTLVLTFNAPVIDLAETLLINPILPQNEKFISENEAYASSPENLLSCGPFKCKSYADDKIVLERNPEYYGLEISNQVLPVNAKMEELATGKNSLSLIRLEFPSDVAKGLVLCTSATTLPLSGYSSAAFEELYQKIYMETTNQRYEYCKQAEQMLSDDGVIFPILSESTQLLMNPEIKQTKINTRLLGFETKWITK